MPAGNKSPNISVVIPVYGCADCLSSLCKRLTETLKSITNTYELILVDDRSPDHAWAEIIKLQDQYPDIKGVRLSRNFGQHLAISAGLAEVQGDIAVVMDCDLQDPPELISEMYTKLLEGNDFVLARRVERSHSVFRLAAAKVYFNILSRVTGEKVDGSYGNFSMLSRKVIDGFLRFGEIERHYLFIIRWLGFKSSSVEYKHEERTIGESSYSLKNLLHHAVDGLFFQATIFLGWIVSIGLAFSLFGVALAIYFIYQYFAYGSVAGWTSVVVLILVCTGILLSSMGVIGLYVGKVFNQTKGRPLYLIDEVLDRRSES